MKNYNLVKTSLLLLVSITIFFISCSKEETNDINTKGKITLTFTNIQNNLKTTDIEDVSAIYISIKDSDGEYVYNMQEFALINLNGAYITGNIELEEGDYTVEDFLVVNDTNGVVYLSPKEDSEFASLVDYPLPYTFTISAKDTSTITLQVISATLGDADQYGYANFTFEVVDTDATWTLANGLIAYYPFNGNADDYSGNENNGTEYNSSNYEEGVIGFAKDFDGINDYIKLDSTLDGSNGLSFSFWVKSRGTIDSSWNGTIVCKYSYYTDARCFCISTFGGNDSSMYENRLGFRFFPYGTKGKHPYIDWVNSNLSLSIDPISTSAHPELFTVIDPKTITLNKWTHCVCNVTSTEMQVWVNDTLAVTRQRYYNQYYNSDSEPTYIGTNHGVVYENRSYNGLLDELRIYNRALTEDEIKQLYELR